MNIELTAPVDCLCDFTYDFYWQHKGSRLSPSGIIPYQKGTSYTYSDLVTSLKTGEDVHIKGDAGMNTGVLLHGGKVIVDSTLEFAGSYMKSGTLIIKGKSRGYVGANMRGGVIFFKGQTMLKPVPAGENDTRELVKLLGISQIEAMMFKKYSAREV